MKPKSIICYALAVIAIVMLAKSYYVCDDALISFAIAENFFRGYGFTYNILERVQVQTNPLWTAVLVPLRWITGEYHYSSMFLTLGLIGWIFYRGHRFFNNANTTILLLLSFITSRALLSISGTGLEVPLSFVLVLETFIAFHHPEERRKTFWVTFWGALAVVNRLDLSLIVFPLSLMTLIKSTHEPTKERIQQFFLGGVPIMLWLMFALIYYGSIFPNTYYAKVGGLTFPQSAKIWSALAYLQAMIQREHVGLLILALPPILFLYKEGKDWKDWTQFVCYVLSVLYVFKVGADHMFPRAFGVPVFYALLYSLQQLEKDTILDEPQFMPVFSGILLLLGLINPFTPLRIQSSLEPLIEEEKYMEELDIISNYRIFDFQIFWLRARLLNFNARKFYEPGNKTKPAFTSQGSAGNVSFFYGPGLHNIDMMALGDPLLSRLPQESDKFNPDHNPRCVPNGYIETLMTQQNLIVDPNLQTFYDKIEILTKGDIFSVQRFGTILKMSFGQYDHLLESYDNSQCIPRKNIIKYVKEVHPINGLDVTICETKFWKNDLFCLKPI